MLRHQERYADLAREIVSHNPDVITTTGIFTSAALKSATSTIPIVGTFGTEALSSGLVTSLARPGGNLTGVGVQGEADIIGKRFEILKEAIPSATKFAVLATQALRDRAWWPRQRQFAAKLGVSLIEAVLPDGSRPAVERGFADLVRQRPDGVLVGPDADPALTGNARRIVQLAEENRLPAIYSTPRYFKLGGLMVYLDYDVEEVARQAAEDVHRILKGAKPGDIPIYLGSRYSLLINLKAARAIGFAIPPALLARADEVIE